MFLVLQLHRFAEGASHSICGPWGCGPPIWTLLAWHGFWVVFLSLPLGLSCRYMHPDWLQRLGKAGLMLGLTSLAAIAIWEATFWLPSAGEWRSRYFLERWLFVVATLVEAPTLEVSLAGLACWITAINRRAAACAHRIAVQETQRNMLT